MPDGRKPVVTLSSRISQPQPIQYDAGSDYLSTFQNIHGDQWVFVRKSGSETAMLYGGDVGWEGHEVRERNATETQRAHEAAGGLRLAKTGLADAIDPLVPTLILNEAERTWLRTAWDSSAWPDDNTRDSQFGAIAEDLIARVRVGGKDPFAKHPNSTDFRAAIQTLLYMLGREAGRRSLTETEGQRLLQKALDLVSDAE